MSSVMSHAARLLALALLLAGCASEPPAGPTYYLLRSDQPLASRALTPDREYAMGTVSIAPYLDQAGLVLETAAGEQRPARHHLWSEPLYNAVTGYLMVEISQARGRDLLPVNAGGGPVEIDVRIDRLHGTKDGRAVLVAYWSLRRDKVVLGSHQFAEERKLEDGSYAALARAEKALLSALASRIAEHLTLPAPVAAVN